MVIFIPAVFLFLYLLVRLVLRAQLSRKAKVAAGMALLLVSQQHLINNTFFGGLSAPQLPSLVLLLEGWLFTSLLAVFILVLLRDLRLVLVWLKRKVIPPRPAAAFSAQRRRFLQTGLSALPAYYGAKQAVVSGMIMIPTAYGVKQSVDAPQVKHMDVRLPRLPAAVDGLRVLQISDLHVSPIIRRDWVQRLVAAANAEQPDLIVFTGDMVDGLPGDRIESMLPLKELRAKYGVYACAGNHEYYSDYPTWMGIIPDLGIRMLLNQHEILRISGHDLVLAGVTDPVAARFNLPGPDIKAALRGAPDSAVRILLEHRPGDAARNPEAGVDLQLSGHTHGGQVLGMTELVAAFNNGFVHGWYQLGNMPMYVNAGAGLWNGFPIRLGVPPEIAVITLRGKAA